MNRNRLMTFGLTGAALTALCCFTPILVGLPGLVGLGVVTGYLNYVLLPALYSLFRRNREDVPGCCSDHSVKTRGRS